MSELKHSRTLFVGTNRKPLVFCMRPGPERRKLAPLLEHGGGYFVTKHKPNIPILVSFDDSYLPEGNHVYFARYIEHCANNNKLMKMNSYRATKNNFHKTLNALKCHAAMNDDKEKNQTEKNAKKPVPQPSTSQHKDNDLDELITMRPLYNLLEQIEIDFSQEKKSRNINSFDVSEISEVAAEPAPSKNTATTQADDLQAPAIEITTSNSDKNETEDKFGLFVAKICEKAKQNPLTSILAAKLYVTHLEKQVEKLIEKDPKSLSHDELKTFHKYLKLDQAVNN